MSIVKVKEGKFKNKYKVRIQPKDKITGKRVNIPVEYADSLNEAKRIERSLWHKYESGYDYGTAEELFPVCFERIISYTIYIFWSYFTNNFTFFNLLPYTYYKFR